MAWTIRGHSGRGVIEGELTSASPLADIPHPARWTSAVLVFILVSAFFPAITFSLAFFRLHKYSESFGSHLSTTIHLARLQLLPRRLALILPFMSNSEATILPLPPAREIPSNFIASVKSWYVHSHCSSP